MYVELGAARSIMEKVLEQGIDSRLRAVTNSEFEETRNERLMCHFSPQDYLTVILRLEDMVYRGEEEWDEDDDMAADLLEDLWSGLWMSTAETAEAIEEDRLLGYYAHYWDEYSEEWGEDLLTSEFILARWNLIKEDEDEYDEDDEA